MLKHPLLYKKYGALYQCVLLLVSNKLHAYEIPGMQIAARQMKRMGFTKMYIPTVKSRSPSAQELVLTCLTSQC